MPRLGELYPGICLTTEEEARKNLSQGSRRVLVYILPKRTHYKTHTYAPTPYKTHTYTPTHYKTHTSTQSHITKPTHTHTHTVQNPHIHYKTHTSTHPHITKPTHTQPHIKKQFKTTTVQVKTNTVQDVPKWNSHNIIKYPQYKVNGTFIHKKFTVMHFTLSTRTSP